MAELVNGIASGLNALLNEYNTVSHNVANSTTVGFKKRMTMFSSKMQDVQDVNAGSLGVSIDSKDVIDFSQGQLLKTDRPLDVALDGKGFLVLETPQGMLYTRNGAMQINILGQLTDQNGYLVSGQSGPITIPRTISDSDLRINKAGMITAGEIPLGQLRIAEFENPSEELESVGNSCFRGPEKIATKPAEHTQIRQGYQERSNVQMVREMTNLLFISRVFEANTDYMKKQTENTQTIVGVANS